MAANEKAKVRSSTRAASIVAVIFLCCPLLMLTKVQTTPMRVLIFAIGAICAVIVYAAGKSADKARARRYEVYKTSVSQAGEEISAAELAKAAGTDEDIALQDLTDMVAADMFPGASIDYVNKKLNLPGGGSLYVKKKKTNAKAEDPLAKDENAHIATLRKCRDMVDDDVIVDRLFHLERSITKIYARLKDHPEDQDEVDVFMNQYLPKITKAIDVYTDLSARDIPGEEVASFKKDLEESLDTYASAFDNVLSKLYQEQVIDVSTDVIALESAMKNDGLLE